MGLQRGRSPHSWKHTSTIHKNAQKLGFKHKWYEIIVSYYYIVALSYKKVSGFSKKCIRPSEMNTCSDARIPTFLTLAEKSVMILRMLLVSAKSLHMYGSSAQITLIARPGPVWGKRVGIVRRKSEHHWLTRYRTQK